MLTGEQFLKQLRSDLNHLYDPDQLRQSPLAALFEIADRFDAPTRLQRILIQAIESLEPKGHEPAHLEAWAIYEPLYYRYVERLSQQEVADQLGMCTRHLRRKQHVACKVLADRLWAQFDLEAKLEAGSDAAALPEQGPTDEPTVDRELAWIENALPDATADLDQTLRTAVDRVRPLTTRYGTHLAVALDSGLPSLAVHPVALTQTLLNLLSVAIHRAPGSQVEVAARSRAGEVCVHVCCAHATSGSQPTSASDAASLDMANRLAAMSGCKLSIAPDRGPDGDSLFEAILAIPICEGLPVLVIDDNADTLGLLQRYASDTRYRIIGLQDPGQALSLAAKHVPQIIVLDVMMPQMDGWELLARLLQAPLTSQIPIVVCTILGQEELAFSLGAHAYLRKPITRQDFLATLDRVRTAALSAYG